MKLLYVWIEKFRNINRQGFAIDNEYYISVDSPDAEDFIYLDSDNQRVILSGSPSTLNRKIYRRKLIIQKKGQHTESCKDSPIKSMTALVGKNASGKTSIIECLHMRADQFNYRNEEQRYYFLVFLNEADNSIVVRSRDIWLVDEDDRKNDLRRDNGYDEYIILLDNNAKSSLLTRNDITHMVSVYRLRQEKTGWAYPVMGVPTMYIDLDRSNPRNAFAGVFDFLSDFPKLGGEDNNLVIYLRDEDSIEKSNYFFMERLTHEEYKSYFIYKLAYLLFGKLRDYLYHEKPQFVLSGKRIRRPEEDVLIKEDRECAEVLSFCCFTYPRSDSTSLSISLGEHQPKDSIEKAISFFRRSTYVFKVKSIYDNYLSALERLFNLLYTANAKLFTAFYKMEIPFTSELRSITAAFQDCLKLNFQNNNWCESIIIDFEWFSAGEYQHAIMFSGLYQRLSERFNGFENRDLILLIDEPEMHMHPETGRRFIVNLEAALNAFKANGLISRCQVILSTHSPFIIRELSGYTNAISLVNKKDGQIFIQDFTDLSQLILPNCTNYSFNLVMYKIFNVSTIELHNELYGVLQEVNQKYSIGVFDSWLKEKIPTGVQVHKKWVPLKNGIAQDPQSVILQTYIRHSIHHPENRLNAGFHEDELQQSINQMINLL